MSKKIEVRVNSAYYGLINGLECLFKLTLEDAELLCKNLVSVVGPKFGPTYLILINRSKRDLILWQNE